MYHIRIKTTDKDTFLADLPTNYKATDEEGNEHLTNITYLGKLVETPAVIDDEGNETTPAVYYPDEYADAMLTLEQIRELANAGLDIIEPFGGHSFGNTQDVLQDLKFALLEELDAEYAVQEDLPVMTSVGIEMDCREIDAQRFTMSLFEAQATGDTGARQVVDYNNVTHTVSYAEFVQIAMEVGAKWKDRFLTKKQSNRERILNGSFSELINFEWRW